MAVHDEGVPGFEPLRPALELLIAGSFRDSGPFLEACDILCRLLSKVVENPDEAKYQKINVRKSKAGGKLVSLPGMEEALAALGWAPVEGGEDGELVLTVGTTGLDEAIARVNAVTGWVRRRSAGVQIVSAIRDPKGWSSELHDPSVLTKDAKFKGAVWDVTPCSCSPDGVVLFHNSPFSNWHVCGKQVRLAHQGQNFSFATSEHVIMAFKQHLLVETALDATLTSQSAIRSPSDAKNAVGRATRGAKDYTWWSHHGMHVVVGTIACYLKFSQDAGLQHLLCSTQKALMVEAAPHDGAWGVAMNSSAFLRGAYPADFALASMVSDTLRFEKNGKVIIRPHGQANALGKALMLTREMLNAQKSEPAEPEVPELRDIAAKVCKFMDHMGMPFDWASAEERLSSCW